MVMMRESSREGLSSNSIEQKQRWKAEENNALVIRGKYYILNIIKYYKYIIKK